MLTKHYRPMNQKNVFVSIIDEAGGEELLTSEIHYNTEIGSFSLSEVLDSENLSQKVEALKDILKRHDVRIGMHGPVINLYDSQDSKVKQVRYYRILQGLDIASQIDAEFLVVHSTYNSLITNKTYPKNWVIGTVDYWRNIVDLAEEKCISIVLENCWDARPEMIKEVVQKVNSRFFKACFDTGHFNIFSQVSIEDWISVWGEDLAHLHLHNNYGEFDEHNGITDGTFDFDRFFAATKDNNINPTMTIEVRQRKYLDTSWQKLDELIIKHGDNFVTSGK